MKKILVTGANSYIGKTFILFMQQFPDYQVDSVQMKNGAWKEKNFTGYDVIFHTAGIAHRKETEGNAQLYYEVNRDLVADVAAKAKASGVRQFIFLSSMSVYGLDTGVITKETVPAPKSNYGKSKLQAEEKLSGIEDETFKVCILRPPMVYGKNCKGNFRSIVKLVKKLPVFPRMKNQRSMLYIDNLCNFVKMSVDNVLNGLYLPQNRKYMNTTQMAGWIAEKLGRKVYMSWLLGFGIEVLRPFVGLARKAFGSLIYRSTEDFDYSYILIDNESSVKACIENGGK